MIKNTNSYCDDLVEVTSPHFRSHFNNVRVAVASNAGELLIARGVVLNTMIAHDGGSVSAHGNPNQVLASGNGSRATIIGKPIEVIAKDNAVVTVFGEPEYVETGNGSHVTIITNDPEYLPETEIGLCSYVSLFFPSITPQPVRPFEDVADYYEAMLETELYIAPDHDTMFDQNDRFLDVLYSGRQEYLQTSAQRQNFKFAIQQILGDGENY